MNAKLRVFNSVIFYIGWFLLLQSAVEGTPWKGVAATAVLILIYLVVSPHAKLDIVMIAIAVVAGLCIETVNMYCDVVHYSSPNLILSGVAPVWVLGVYALFGTSLNSSFGYLTNFPLLGMLMGAVGAPFSWVIGIKLGAAEFGMEFWTSYCILGAIWAVLMPALTLLNLRLRARLINAS